jgi:hypothetical protein
MDIAATSTAMAQSSLSLEVGMKVLSLAKDQSKQQGEANVQMMQQSLDPNLGRKIDIRV